MLLKEHPPFEESTITVTAPRGAAIGETNIDLGWDLALYSVLRSRVVEGLGDLDGPPPKAGWNLK